MFFSLYDAYDYTDKHETYRKKRKFIDRTNWNKKCRVSVYHIWNTETEKNFLSKSRFNDL